jgi:CRISPR system Cascade subunit CasD
MKHYLLFSLFGPMASWGDIAVGETRPSYSYPTKSAILGLCAAALGIKREEADRLSHLSASVHFAVCVERDGQFMIDYHTTQVPSEASLKKRPHHTRRQELSVDKLETILSTRDYYCDALYTIVLWQDEASTSITLVEIKDALKKPNFVLYLGRKSCPLAIPMMPKIIEKNTLEDVLTDYVADPTRKKIISTILTAKKSANTDLKIHTDVAGSDVTQLMRQQTHTRKDQLLHRGAWQYTDREEHLYLLSTTQEDA